MAAENVREELKQYIENTTRIRELSSPHVKSMADADDYRARLIENFVQIGAIAKQNGVILEKNYYPLIDADAPLNKNEIEDIRAFSDALADAYQLSFLDIPMVYEQAKRLLREAEHAREESDRVLALDGMVSASYEMLCVTARLYPASDLCLQYRDAGFEAATRLLSYLDHDKFRTLDDFSKKLVLVNARYIRMVSEIDCVPCTPEENERNLKLMEDALLLEKDPFYREQLPSYDWDYHVYRTLEYIAAFTDMNNPHKFDRTALKKINEYTKRLATMYMSDEERYGNYQIAQVLEISLCRNAYLADEMTLADYKRELRRIYENHVKKDADQMSFPVLLAPLEYILVTDREHPAEEDLVFLNEFYHAAIWFMHRVPKKNSMIFLLFYVYRILSSFIEIPGGMEYETLCLDMVAAIHPLTYIHSRSVADLSVCIAEHLLKKKPELFGNLPFLQGITNTEQRMSATKEFVYHAALCHDFGKLLIAEAILTYGRDLLEREFDLVGVHPAAGAILLSKNASTAPYADIAHGHHKWYNNRGGYPEPFDLHASPYRTVIEIVTCADCMDAATDAVGRSYKEGKSLENFLAELREGAGEQYAPYLPELFEDRAFYAKIEQMLTRGRDENYRETFHILKQHETV